MQCRKTHPVVLQGDHHHPLRSGAPPLVHTTTAKKERTITLASLEKQNLDDWLESAERQLIRNTLEKNRGVQVQTARLLGITERSSGIDSKNWVSAYHA
ncbi:MAG: hypothetical protein H7829_08500 [Magnetococcus sp. THC-1_WYH]